MENRMWCGFVATLCVAGALGCNVKAGPPDTGGFGASGGEGGSGGGSVELRGAIVLNTDYASTSVSLLSKAGKVLSPVFISSASQTPGLSTPLSGDVVLASSDAIGKEVVLVDRSESVLSWVNVKSADVRAQLNVGTGFNADPHDYVELSSNKAYVTRYAGNGEPGKEDFDAGNDVLIIDPSVPEITGSIDLSEVEGNTAGYVPTADYMMLAGDRVRVTLLGLKPDFSAILDARVVSIDPESDEITQTLTLDGKSNCGQMALSPDGEQLALACWGFRAFDADPKADLPDGGVVLLKVGDDLDKEEELDASLFGNAPISGVTYVDATHLLVTTFGAFESGDYPAVDDQAILFDLEKKRGETILKSDGTAFTLGGAACIAGTCFLADSGRDGGVVQMLETNGAELVLAKSLHADTETGLPPYLITRF